MTADVPEKAIASLVRVGEADARLLLAVEGRGWCFRVAPMPTVDAVDDGAGFPLEAEERADAIHGGQDSNRPVGNTAGAANEMSGK